MQDPAPDPARAAPTPPACPDCGSELSRSQPDEARPNRLLGVCTGCGRWFRIDAATGSFRRVAGPVN